jgi:arabinose-5-phosphate isomerase
MGIVEYAKEVLRIESESISSLIKRIGPEFERAVNMILNAPGRVILTGIGKSGLIGRKISATLNSTGTPSIFLHPAEALHGDLGMVTKDDIVIAISNGGRTIEINRLLPILRNMGVKIIAFTGDVNSPMSKMSDLVIDVGVEREACPMGLAPTASTTAALAMGDALAVALIRCRRFTRDDFKRFHPGGSLGERLASRVSEIMLTGDRIPIVSTGATMMHALEEINNKGIGATLVVREDKRLVGIICDGDIRRAIIKYGNIQDMKVEDVMTPSPKIVDENQSAGEALSLMEFYGITHLVIIDEIGRVKGIIHLHDILGREEFRINAGIFSTQGIDS